MTGSPTSPRLPGLAPDIVERHLASIRVKQLERYLADTDAACPACGYDLRGHQGGICPECGRRLAVVPGRRWPLTATFVALSLGSGLHGAAIVASIVFLLTDDTARHAALRAIASAAPFFALHTFLLVQLIMGGRGFQFRTKALKLVALAGAWLLLAAGIAVFRFVNI